MIPDAAFYAAGVAATLVTVMLLAALFSEPNE